ncbi:7408_t:CDS:2 [Ambispora gerdemannii]|uniref:7408_t:CDS:1 n=1 Tax=Ambispora gerdemannii TaxID=144530 RepID=A0A9N9BTN3_9GLOM|nr:7408_t:CDS:2 [Ambispora gerdemannii]
MRPPPELPIDILPNIIAHLVKDDANTLFSCLLVSRIWCRLIIPILWRNPFHYTDYLKKESTREEKQSKIIDVYISCLSADAKKRLKDRTDIKILLSLSSSKRLFNYPKYISSLDDKRILCAVWDWKLKREPSIDGHDVYHLLFALIRMFAEESQSLQHLSLNSCFYDKSMDRKKKFSPKDSFPSLSSSPSESSRKILLVDIYSAIASSQRKFKTICVSKANALSPEEAMIETTQIVTIIKAQGKYLTEFTISSCKYGLDEIIDALRFGATAKSLRSLTFNGCDFAQLSSPQIATTVEFFSRMENVLFRMCHGYKGEFLDALEKKMVLDHSVGGFVTNIEAREKPSKEA